MEADRRTRKRPIFVWWAHLLIWVFPVALVVLLTLSLSGLLILLVASLASAPCGERVVRFVSLLFEIIGLLVALYGFNELRRLFGRSSALRIARDYFARFPKRVEKPSVVATMSASIDASGSAVASGRIRAAPSASIEVRLGALEQNLELIDSDLSSMLRDFRTAKANTDAAISHEAAERRAQLGEIDRKLHGISVDGISVNLIGVFVFFVAAAVSTFSEEVSVGLGFAQTCDVVR